MKIVSIEKGWGEGSTYFKVAKEITHPHLVHEIKSELKSIGENTAILVYRGYIDNSLVFEIEANSQLTIIFEKE